KTGGAARKHDKYADKVGKPKTHRKGSNEHKPKD
ncbi:MAG: hypothetical protein ACI9QL_002349, partial [Candidatus Omnitrophota bacterium]